MLVANTAQARKARRLLSQGIEGRNAWRSGIGVPHVIPGFSNGFSFNHQP